MSQEKPGWYYVGNGHLRYMDTDGWTDQYTLADGAAKADAGPNDASPEDPGPATGVDVRGRDARGPSPFIKLCVTASKRVIATLIHLMVALGRMMVALWRFVAARYRAARYRKATARPSNRSAVSAQLSLASRNDVPTSHQIETRTCAECGATVRAVARFCPLCRAAMV